MDKFFDRLGDLLQSLLGGDLTRSGGYGVAALDGVNGWVDARNNWWNDPACQSCVPNSMGTHNCVAFVK